ncbi:MAG: indolepyruvate ferredoxin oxidoreductase [Candidatus Rokubacteria bacterium 13_1_40CM_4_69_5]|nr:MAG: indolepyruvate ferredoxin oxidoreductase [Candidatus Rokubacteria bacterium 13_1_40CM_4_69_5]OLE36678.1 MAG: indolepyruvate ferredoxin oxidoreductase [Candidatus Rokubacteria bacterium 13_1_20CM_2_70_7]
MGERTFAEDVTQLGYGAGQILRGEGILAITKALLQSGVSYVGGYPGAPISHLLDVMADANAPLLTPMGIYFEQSGSEAAAAALLGASINYPMRGAVTWKSVVGTNVASDALSHVASAGVIGGALIVIGEDYGEGASILQERTHSSALKSSVPLIDPRNSLPSFARFVEEGFGLSEACQEPVFFSIRIRACHMRGTLRCRDNVHPQISMLAPLAAPSFSLERINLPPFTYAMEAQKFEKRLPAARRYIVEHGLNEHHRGEEAHLGIVMQGGLWNTTLRGLHALGLADVYGRTAVPLLVLNVLHPTAPEELIGFLRGKRHVLVVEEGMPSYVEQELKALAHEAKLDVAIHGKDLLSPHGEYVPQLVITGLQRFLARAETRSVGAALLEERYRALFGHQEKVRAALPQPIAKRPPTFCTGCPERPVFSAMKILRATEPAIGDTHVAADIGCHTFSTQAPFNVGNSVLGYGMGLASASAVAPLFGKRVVSIMGDGGFWHNGLSNGVANAVFNKQDSVLVILDNFYTSATGQHHNPSTGKNARGEPTGMTIPEALRGVGVRWIRTVNAYRIGEMIGTLRQALTARYDGLKVIIARGECQLERQRRERPLMRQRAAAGRPVIQPRFGVDPDVCTGDHSCMRLNGCPSLTLRENPDPLRDDPIAHVDQTCVGCGVCGEVAHAAVLCPSFYEVRIVRNPGRGRRWLGRVRRAVIGRLATA